MEIQKSESKRKELHTKSMRIPLTVEEKLILAKAAVIIRNEVPSDVKRNDLGLASVWRRVIVDSAQHIMGFDIEQKEIKINKDIKIRTVKDAFNNSTKKDSEKLCYKTVYEFKSEMIATMCDYAYNSIIFIENILKREGNNIKKFHEVYIIHENKGGYYEEQLKISIYNKMLRDYHKR
jgi:hypothetical protein